MNFTDLSIAIASFKKGEPIIVVDALSRENEGDIVFPADCSTADKINDGVTLLLGEEAAPVPCVLVAVTVNVYATPFVKPVTTHGVLEQVTETDEPPPTGVAVIV